MDSGPLSLSVLLQGTEQDLGYLLKTAFRAHPAVKKAKRGKRGVRWQGLAVAAETRRAPG